MDKLTNPLQDIFLNIKKILDFIEIKDQRLADSLETSESRDNAEVWIASLIDSDTYLTYRRWWEFNMFQDIMPNVKLNDFKEWFAQPFRVPLIYREHLRRKGREQFLNTYEEQNDYYRMLSGLPPINTKVSDFVYISEATQLELGIISPDDDEETKLSKRIPVHMLSTLLQNRYMTTDEYKNKVSENPSFKYLKYLGFLKIDIFTARKANDFELIRSYPLDRSDINPNLLKEFISIYSAYREYMKWTLYNDQLEGIFKNYRNFMRVTLIAWTIMQVCNKAVEGIPGRKFLDDAILHIILSMYGIPRSLLMTQEVRRSLVANLLKLTKKKAIDDVYYDLVKILGYQDIIISKLMLMKGQQFDNGQVIMENGKPKYVPYFLKIDSRDKDPYDSISKGNVTKYDYTSVINDDPTWWNSPDTEEILLNSNYTMAASKYIEIDAIIYQIKYLFESIFFIKMIIDNKKYTNNFTITIPEIFGTDPISIYDLMIYIVAAVCRNSGLSGEILTSEELAQLELNGRITTYDYNLLGTAGFNFNLDLDLFQEYLNSTKFVDKDKVMLFMENLSMKDSADISRLFYEVLVPMRDWLEYKIVEATSRQEYLEYESIYRALYTCDSENTITWHDFEMPLEIIKKNLDISSEDMIAYMHYYPRNIDGSAMTYDVFPTSRYNPFVSKEHRNITWFIDVPYKGKLYFHDILNSQDLLTLKTELGDYFFLDSRGESDLTSISDAKRLIEGLDDRELNFATFIADIRVMDSDLSFSAGHLIPSSIRSSIYKQILIDKITMDTNGMAKCPTTYEEYLHRKNKRLYDMMVNDNNSEKLMTIVLALETELNMHLKYFELSVGGRDLFFNPLITLIQRFKSTLVNISKIGIKHIIADKIDAGGNSNMVKLFDSFTNIIKFTLSSRIPDYIKFGLYDSFRRTRQHIMIRDHSNMLGRTVNPRSASSGSIRMVDEIKVYINGVDADKAEFRAGELSVGRWENDEEIILRARENSHTIHSAPYDTTYWMNLVESYIDD